MTEPKKETDWVAVLEIMDECAPLGDLSEADQPHDMCIYYPEKPCYPDSEICDCPKSPWS